MNFQDMIMRLNQFWASQGRILWQPHNEHVGAGTSNPATVLRVLGPEPWNVAYPEPSARPADGRYGENPNRWYEYFQYQVLLKPEPGNPIDLYLQSLTALGISWQQHDIRFVEDNWQSPSLGAWGLGWEVWLDGLEITQYTYFQQACGVELDPISVEITYGLERIALFLQGASSIPEIGWLGDVSYGDVHLPEETDYCRYNFDIADVKRLQQMYMLFEAEAQSAIDHKLVLPAHDHLLRCSHTFNVLDARGAIGVAQRAQFFARMRELARQIADLYVTQRERLGFPLAKRRAAWLSRVVPERKSAVHAAKEEAADLVLEIGTEELPTQDLTRALEQLETVVPEHLSEARLEYRKVCVSGTPRRLVIYVESLSPRQRDLDRLVKGPASQIAFDPHGQPTPAATGFARQVGTPIDQLKLRELEGKAYLVSETREQGRPTSEVLKWALPRIIAALQFPMAMRWNETRVVFARPIRWLVALYGESLVDMEYARVPSDRLTYALRAADTPRSVLERAEDYFRILEAHGVVIDPAARRQRIQERARVLASEVGGQVLGDSELLAKVANLIDNPVVLRGAFDPAALALPQEVLVTVMKKHQRYFPVVKDGELLPYFITVANGRSNYEDTIRAGNEGVLRARFSDARFFYDSDLRRPLAECRSKLNSLSFQEQLGPYNAKTERIVQLAAHLAEELHLNETERTMIQRTAELCKADLVTQMIVELTDLQGTMGRVYAFQSGEDPRVAWGIQEHYQPRFAGDRLPTDWPGIVVGLADRFDSLVGLFAVGHGPTSAADPHGLRRTALCIVQVMIDRNLYVPLPRVTEKAAGLLPVAVESEMIAKIVDFIQRRLQGWLIDQGFRRDLVEAVLSEQGDIPARAYADLVSLASWAGRPEFDSVIAAYSRVARIVRAVAETWPLDPEHLIEPPAQRLYAAYCDTRGKVDVCPDLGVLLQSLFMMVEPITTFFNEVLVMHEEKALRQACLALLQSIAQLPGGIVDLNRINVFEAKQP